MVDGWYTCNNCGKRYGTFLSNCPSCGAKSTASHMKMGKWKKIGIIAAVIVVAWVTINLSIYYSNPKVAQQVDAIANNAVQNLDSDTAKIIGITSYDTAKSGSVYQVYFGLQDRNANYLSSDAKIDFKVTNAAGKTIYTDSFNIKKQDFFNFYFNRGGSFYGYAWNIDEGKLQEIANEYGTAHITVTLPNGKSFSADTSI